MNNIKTYNDFVTEAYSYGDSEYLIKNIEYFIEQNKHAEYPLKIKLSGEDWSSNFLNINPDQLTAFVETLKQNK